MTSASVTQSLPQRRSATIAARRGFVLVGMNLLVPGSAQLAAGNARLGRAAMRVWLTLVLAAVALVVAGFAARGPVLGALANPVVLTVGCWLVLVVGVAWIALLVDAWRIANPAGMSARGRTTSGALALVLAVVIGTVSWGAHTTLAASAQFVDTVFVGGGTQETHDGRINVLLLGGDAGAGRVGLRPDSITVASIDADSGRIVLFGLPRNLQHAPFPADSPLHAKYPGGYYCKSMECMLNAVYTLGENSKALFPGVEYPGVEATKGVVEETLGIPINYWAMIDLAGFRQLIDAVGGITLDIRTRQPIGISHDKTGITGWIEPGKNVRLDGYHALWYARAREGSSDYDRMVRQKCVLNAMVKQLSPATVATKFEAIAAAGKNVVATNVPSAEIGTMLDLVTKSRGLPMGSVSFTPPLIKPANPDFAKIRQSVADAIAASEALDEPTPSATPAATPTASGSPSPKAKPKPQVDDITAVCSVS